MYCSRVNTEMNIHKIPISIGIYCVLFLTSMACYMSPKPSQSGSLLLKDDFSQSETSWEIWSKDGESAVGLVDGKLTMILQQPNTDIVTTNHVNQSNVELSVFVQKEHGSSDNLIGLVCRYQNDDNYYGFLISSDGYFGIVKKTNGEVNLLNSDMMQYSEIIIKGNAQNHLSAVCDGEVLAFFVNDVELARIMDNDLTYGGNGFVIGSFSEPNDLVVSFDEFTLLAR